MRRLLFGVAMTPALPALANPSPLPDTEAGIAVTVVSDETATEPAPGKVGFAPVVGLTYSNETGAMVGTAGLLFFKPPPASDRRTSQITAAAAYSARRQFVASLSGDLFLWRDAVRIQAALNYLFFPDSFFGIGSDTLLADRERFTPRIYELRFSPQLRVLRDLFVGPAVRIDDITILEVERSGVLATGDVLGSAGGFDWSFGLGASYDTRDNTLYPLRGTLLQYSTLVSEPELGSDYRMSRTWLDYRRYFSLPVPDHVAAIQLLGRFSTGEVPFFSLARLGGERLLRGHFNGRYRDRQLLAVQIEYRLPLVWRLGAIAFAGVGDVARRLGRFEWTETKYSVGGGARLNVSKRDRVNMRADFGWGGDEYGAYVGVGEVF
ncbi:MAG: BamA/TamA family outer membrane protein [Polyangiaceae bacterium]|nr:BamA/TamA family outer membrane protein [Polyangiaceae bacterium]